MKDDGGQWGNGGSGLLSGLQDNAGSGGGGLLCDTRVGRRDSGGDGLHSSDEDDAAL
jgi:hypothetical protein